MSYTTAITIHLSDPTEHKVVAEMHAESVARVIEQALADHPDLGELNPSKAIIGPSIRDDGKA